MLDQLQQTIKEYSDEELINQFLNHKDEYTDEALVIINEEIELRNIDLEAEKMKKAEMPEVTQLDENDFVLFDHSFNKIDLELAITVLRENGIFFYVDNPSSTNTIPLDSEADKQFTLHIYHKRVPEAHQLLDEHFQKVDGRYKLKNMGILEQLKAFSFFQLHLDEKEAKETVEVEFSEKERDLLIHYGNIVIKDAEKIEKEQDRAIFYFDLIEPLIKQIPDQSVTTYTKTELLTILEILQIACYYNDFPSDMDSTIESLLGFFQV